MKPTALKVAIVIITALTTVVVLSGCNDILGNEEDDEKDGNLTVSISGFNGTCDSDVPYLIGWVLPAGTDPMTTDPVGVGYKSLESTTSGSLVVKTVGDSGPTDTVWTGNGGNTYDVYPTIYCTTIETFDPDTDEPKWIHKAADYSQPVSYEQDGNATISTTFDEYVGLF